MKILLCGEGPQDIGRVEVFARPETVTEGWMQPLVRRILHEPEVDMHGLTRKHIILLPRDRQRHRPLPAGHGERALAAKLVALSGGYDMVIYMVDADSPDRQDFDRIRGQILDGLNRLRPVAGIACVPVSAAESWLLSDPEAWRSLGLTNSSLLPRRPEASWGAPRDPAGHHPHVDFSKACEDAGVSDSLETRADLARQIDLTLLRRRCGISFGAFADDLIARL